MNRTIFLAGIIAVTIVAGIIASGELVEGVKPNNTGTFLEVKVSGTLTCPDTTVLNGYDLFVRVNAKTGTGIVAGNLQGVPAISDASGFVGVLTTNDFAYSVIIGEASCAGSANERATVATISGTCGIDETVNFSTNTGVTGIFTGRVACI